MLLKTILWNFDLSEGFYYIKSSFTVTSEFNTIKVHKETVGGQTYFL